MLMLMPILQGMRGPTSVSQPGSVWATNPNRPSGNSSLNNSETPSASLPSQFSSQSGAPGVGFPFPGRRESWGFVPPSPNSGPFLPGMHSGLGEQIVLPSGAQTGFTESLGQDLGETASEFLRRQAQSRIAQACETVPWLNPDLQNSGGYKVNPSPSSSQLFFTLYLLPSAWITFCF